MLLSRRYHKHTSIAFFISAAGPPPGEQGLPLTPTPSFSDYLVATWGSKSTYSFLMIVFSSLLLLALLPPGNKSVFLSSCSWAFSWWNQTTGKNEIIKWVVFYCRSLICSSLKVEGSFFYSLFIYIFTLLLLKHTECFMKLHVILMQGPG